MMLDLVDDTRALLGRVLVYYDSLLVQLEDTKPSENLVAEIEPSPERENDAMLISLSGVLVALDQIMRGKDDATSALASIVKSTLLGQMRGMIEDVTRSMMSHGHASQVLREVVP